MVTAAQDSSRTAATLRVLAVALIPVLVLVLRHADWPPPASAGDYAQYLLHALALVEGRAYGDIGYIYHPAAGLVGPPVLPPGLPLTLAPIVALDGVHSPLLRVLLVGSLLAFAVLAALRLARDIAPWQAALGAAFAAFAVEAALGTVAPLSDPGFAALLWGTILVADYRQPWSWRRVAAVTVLGFACVAYRTAGVALAPGLLLYALLHRRTLGVRPAIPTLVWLVTGGLALAAGAADVPFSERLPGIAADLGEHLRTFNRQYTWALLEAQLYPFADGTLNDVYHIVFLPPMLAGTALIAWRARRSFMIALSLAYALMLLGAPVAEPRYAWPLFPLLCAGLIVGVTEAVRFVLRRSQRGAAITGSAVAAAILLLSMFTALRRPQPPAIVEDADARALFNWAQQRAAQDSAGLRIAFYNPRVLTLEAGVPAMGIPARTAPGQLQALREARITHIVWQGGDEGAIPCLQRTANRLVQDYPRFMTLDFAQGRFRAYRLQIDESVMRQPWEPLDWSTC